MILNASARFPQALPPRRESRSSVQTRRSSLPGLYSQRKRRLLETVRSPVYCTSALANMRGERVVGPEPQHGLVRLAHRKVEEVQAHPGLERQVVRDHHPSLVDRDRPDRAVVEVPPLKRHRPDARLWGPSW